MPKHLLGQGECWEAGAWWQGETLASTLGSGAFNNCSLGCPSPASWALCEALAHALPLDKMA